MDTQKVLERFIKEAVATKDDFVLQSLTGDASDRRYYRIDFGGLKPDMIAVVSTPFTNQDPVLVVNQEFKRLGVPVPNIIASIPEQGLVIKEDLGSVHLEGVESKKELKTYYLKVLDIMLGYQKNADKGSFIELAFTKDKFLSELRMSSEYFLKQYCNKDFNTSVEQSINTFYEELVDELMELPKLLQHRDYHSRNLMIKEQEVYVIDYQDARFGPYTYDLASLLIDPYINLDEQFIKDLKEKYFLGIKGLINCSEEDFELAYSLSYLQRGIKILGTFAHQKLVKNNERYLPYIKPSRDKLFSVLHKFPRWSELIKEVF